MDAKCSCGNPFLITKGIAVSGGVKCHLCGEISKDRQVAEEFVSQRNREVAYEKEAP